MWSGGKEENDNGEAVLLMQPTPGASKKRKSKAKRCNQNISNKCYIGGQPTFFPNDDILGKFNIFGNKSSNKLNQSNSSGEEKELLCEVCDRALYLISQVNAPINGLERTLYIFGCNYHECLKKRHDDDKMLATNDDTVQFYSGKGVFRCIRSQSKIVKKSENKKMVEETFDEDPWDDTGTKIKIDHMNTDDEGGWGDNNDYEDGTGAWGDSGDEEGWGTEAKDELNAGNENMKSMQELEAMLSACEVDIDKTNDNNPVIERITNASESKQKLDINMNARNLYTCSASFPQYELELFDEPYSSSVRKVCADDDDSDFDGEDLENDNAVQSMLSRYLEDDKELDPELMKLLKLNSNVNTTNASNFSKTSQQYDGKGNNSKKKGGEKYERLPPDQRALFAFMERLKRSPHQSVRYAYGGEPVWAAPTTMTNKIEATKKNSRGKKKKSNSQTTTSLLPEIPPCVCGARRAFEFQLMPSILHVLNVDEHVNKTYIPSSTLEDSNQVSTQNSRGANVNIGMNWGAISVYSCVNSCDQSREEFLVLQASVDDIPSFHQKQSNQDNDDDNVDEGDRI